MGLPQILQAPARRVIEKGPNSGTATTANFVESLNFGTNFGFSEFSCCGLISMAHSPTPIVMSMETSMGPPCGCGPQEGRCAGWMDPDRWRLARSSGSFSCRFSWTVSPSFAD
jgi:hypothetical protein